MIRSIVPLTSLLLSDALVLLGHGLLLTLLPITARNIGFNDFQIGFIGTSYFIGFVIGCLLTPFALKRVGHIRSFAVLASAYTAVILLFAWSQSFVGWMLLRVMVGVLVAGIYMIIESWLNERSEPNTRGTILSFYAMLNLAMITLSQQLLNLNSIDPIMLFAMAAVFLSLSIVPVSLTLALAPTPVNKVTLDFKKVWHHSHVGLIGCLFSGLITGAFWALAPLYAKDSGFSTAQLANFMSAVVLGGALFQIPLGRLSDKFDRRLVLLFITLVGTAVSLTIFFASFTDSFAGYFSTSSALIWGGFSMTIYSICLAHANDGADSSDFVDIGSAMLIMYGLSSALGGPLASIMMSVFGHQFLFAFMALFFLVFSGFLIMRRHNHILPITTDTTEDHEAFQFQAGMTTPAVYNLDPRSDDMTEMATEEEYEREVSDIDVNYQDVMDLPDDYDPAASTATEDAEAEQTQTDQHDVKTDPKKPAN